MIAVKVVGGLGNQFFQYAAAKTLADKHNVSVGLDINSIKGNYKEGNFRRKFKLNKFNINFKELSLDEIKTYLWSSGNRFFDDRIIRKFYLFEKNVWHDTGNVEDFNLQPNDIYLIGHFVNPNYFERMREVFRKEFVLKDKCNIKNLLKEIRNSNSISVHIRRGDLLRLKNSYILNKKYYLNSFRIIEKNVKNPVYYFFSDDIEWCKENFRDLKNVVFVEGNDVAEDFELMKSCKHNILANSTLSWWAGYLNPNSDAIIIAPKHFNIFKNPAHGMQLNSWVVI